MSKSTCVHFFFNTDYLKILLHKMDNRMVYNTCNSFAIHEIPISLYQPESNWVWKRAIGTWKNQLDNTNDTSSTVFQCNNSVHSVLQWLPMNVWYIIRPKIITDERDCKREVEITRQDITNRIIYQKRVNEKLVDLRQTTKKSHKVEDFV